MGGTIPINQVKNDDRKGKFERLADKVDIFFSFLIIVLLIIIVASTFMQVIFRFILNSPLIWPEEIARMSYVWISFLGMALLVRRGTLLGVDTLLQAVNDRLKKVFVFFSRIIMFLMLIIITWLGYEMLARVQGQSLPATSLSTQWMYVIAPISGALAIFNLLEIMFRKKFE